MREECGIFGIYGNKEAAKLAYLGLYALQHRGQESAGIVSSDGLQLHSHREMGLVADVFNEPTLGRLPGNMAIGHVRYSTSGATELKNAQPFLVDYARGSLAIAHNGNLVNAAHLKSQLEEYGCIFQSTMDTEVIIHLLATSREKSFEARLADSLVRVRGAYSVLLLTQQQLVAARDPNGFRPLVLGRLKDATVVASETCALDLIEAEYEREIEPGEMLIVDDSGTRSVRPFQPARKALCIFEFVYFSRPDSIVYGKPVYDVRKELGRELAREHPAGADLVIPVPDSGVPAAIGYAEQIGLPYQMGLIRNHYVGRTFIEPEDSIRHFGAKVKLNAVRSVLDGKRVVVIDDSIVRGTTSQKIIRMVRNAGAKEIHFRISAPPTQYPCYYGIDTPTRKELIASSQSVEQIRDFIGADSLGYLSKAGLHRASERLRSGYCDACFSGDYPVRLEADRNSDHLGLFERRSD